MKLYEIRVDHRQRRDNVHYLPKKTQATTLILNSFLIYMKMIWKYFKFIHIWC